MKKFYQTLLALVLACSTLLNAQSVGINTTGANADNSAMLDVSSDSKGFLAPRMTAAQRGAIASPASGLMVYQTDGDSGYYYHNGTSWIKFDTGTTSSQWTSQGNDLYYGSGSIILNSFGNKDGSGIFFRPGYTYNMGITAHDWNGNNVASDGLLLSAYDGIGFMTGSDTYNAGKIGLMVHNNGNVGINTLSPTQKLDVNGQIRIQGGSPGAGKVLTSSADGTASWTTPQVGTPSQWASGSGNISYNSGNVGIGTATPTEKVHINNGNFLVTGDGTSPDLTASGPGARMFFYPAIAAFRAGVVDGTEWDYANTGSCSFASGYNSIASGTVSTACGFNTTASGDRSFASGFGTIASGLMSIAGGTNTTASGNTSFAIGFSTTASGYFTTAMGVYAKATGDFSFAVNLNNNQAMAASVAANTFRISSATAIGGNVAWTNWNAKNSKGESFESKSESSLNKIMQLSAVKYAAKGDDKAALGLNPESLQKAIPEAVSDDTVNNCYGITYETVIPVLVEAVKEQQNTITTQQKQIEELKELVKQLTNR